MNRNDPDCAEGRGSAPPPDPRADRCPDEKPDFLVRDRNRRRIAELVGLLIARDWLRTRDGEPSAGATPRSLP